MYIYVRALCVAKFYVCMHACFITCLCENTVCECVCMNVTIVKKKNIGNYIKLFV